jgi:hypothetical protein
MKVTAIRKDLKSIEKVDGRAGADTLRLWESYREQSYLWRALFLLQLPVTLASLIGIIVLYLSADTIIEVPEKPQPGQYSVAKLPDSEFISMATQVVNLISSYQQYTARQQFKTTRKYLWEPALSQFEKEMMEDELRMIEETGRSQMFFVDTRQIKVERHPSLDKVVVRIPGVRQKLIAKEALPPDEMVYYVKMTTIPRNIHNEFGIVVIDIQARIAPLRLIADEDRREEREKEREEKKKSKKK